jgi:hypothetical protein
MKRMHGNSLDRKANIRVLRARSLLEVDRGMLAELLAILRRSDPAAARIVVMC